jgi:hypothetical protein
MSQQEEEDLRSQVIADLGHELDRIPDEEEREQKIQAETQRRWQENWRTIQPIHHWRDANLGENETRDGSEGQGFVSWVGGVIGAVLSGLRGGSRAENLVLLVRGDLLKKYPNTLIYAVQAEWMEIRDGEKVVRARRPNFDHETRFPIFRGTLPPDITFLGFDLEEDQARGSPQEGDDDPGWFFVFEERISEARFGLDTLTKGEKPPELSSWDKLCWGHLEDKLSASKSKFIDGLELSLDREPEDEEPQWGAHAGAQASITFQKPVRIAIHADDMLPGSSAGQP